MAVDFESSMLRITTRKWGAEYLHIAESGVVALRKLTSVSRVLISFIAISFAVTDSPTRAQEGENWLLGESGATGEADLKIDVAAAKRALGGDVSSADAQKRVTKAMGEFLKSHPGKNRVFDASTAPANAVDVTPEFVELISGHRGEDSHEAKLGSSQTSEEPPVTQVQVQTPAEARIVVTGQRLEPLVAPHDLTASASVPLVTLTFPATITPRAEALLLETLRKNKWPSGCGVFWAQCSDNENYLDQIVAKTTYYVSDVYAALTRGLPPNSVVIQPATLDVDGSGRFSYRLLDNELPSAITLDFIAFVAPRYYPTGPSTAYTNGLYVLPALVASSEPQSRNDSGQLFAISQGISPSNVGAHPSVLAQLAATAEQKRTDPPKSVVMFDDNQLKITDTQWRHVESPIRIPEFAAELMAVELKPFVAAVNTVDRKAIERAQLARYASLYSDAMRTAGPIAWTLLPEFISAEREFTNSSTLEDLKTLREGEFGQSFRKMLLAEREENKRAGRARVSGALTGMLGGYLAGRSGSSSMPEMIKSVMDQQAALSHAGEAFSASVGGVSVAQRSVVIQMGERQETVIAGTIAELREKFRQLLLAQAAAPQPTAN